MIGSTRHRCRVALSLRIALLAAALTAGWLGAAPLAPTAAATPLQQLFQCDLAGTPGVGVHECSNWATGAVAAGPGGTVTVSHVCEGGRIVIYWEYHWDGAPFIVNSHTFDAGGGLERQGLTVVATNEGHGPGTFWLTGRCRTP